MQLYDFIYVLLHVYRIRGTVGSNLHPQDQLFLCCQPLSQCDSLNVVLEENDVVDCCGSRSELVREEFHVQMGD